MNLFECQTGDDVQEDVVFDTVCELYCNCQFVTTVYILYIHNVFLLHDRLKIFTRYVESCALNRYHSLIYCDNIVCIINNQCEHQVRYTVYICTGTSDTSKSNKVTYNTISPPPNTRTADLLASVGSLRIGSASDSNPRCTPTRSTPGSCLDRAGPAPDRGWGVCVCVCVGGSRCR